MMFGKPSRRQLAEMCRKLSTLFDAGVPVRKALALLAQGPGRLSKEVIEDARASLAAGDSVTEAFSLHRGYFPPLFLTLVEVGERTGTLERVLSYLADYYENMDMLFRKLFRSMIYPAFVITLAILVTGMLKYIFVEFRANISGVPPPPGAAQQAVVWHFVFWFGGIGLLIAMVVLFRTVLHGGATMDRLLLRAPVLGKALQKLAVARFTWAFQLSQAAGLGVSETIQRGLLSTGNQAFAAEEEQVLSLVKSGVGLRDSLEASGLFPRDTLEMIEVAETSGKLEESMGRIAKNAFGDAEFAINALAKAFGWFVWAVAAGVTAYYVLWFYAQYLNAVGSMMS
ncbi:MAG: type II secretion system F family protein [Planctomycetes bacterium]|nr:type II secretion system F family protein [Planctomycetota bacterium]